MPFQFTVNPSKLSKLQKKLKTLTQVPADKRTAQAAGNAAVRAAKALIKGGTSPIKQIGSFDAYIKPSRYPGKRKAHSPVNLKLSGQFLAALIAKAVKRRKGWAFEYGYMNSKVAQIKEKGHREGANGQPSRPTVPDPPGETFHRNVVDAYLRVFKKRISRLTKS